MSQPQSSVSCLLCHKHWVIAESQSSPVDGKILCVELWYVVLATDPNSRCSSGSGSTLTKIIAISFTTLKTRTVAVGPVLPTNTRHINLATLAPIKYLGFDHIVTWSICRLSCCDPSFTSCCGICNQPNIRWVVIKTGECRRQWAVDSL